MFQASATAIHASVVPAHVSPTFVTIIASVYITCVTTEGVNPVSGVRIVHSTVAKAVIVEPVINIPGIAQHARTDIMVNHVNGLVMRTV